MKFSSIYFYRNYYKKHISKYFYSILKLYKYKIYLIFNKNKI